MNQTIRSIPFFDRVGTALVARANALSSSLICDAAGRRGALPTGIRPLDDGMRVCGPAFTVGLADGDNLMFHYALTLARPGDVIVVAHEGGEPDCALFGELMATQSEAAGAAGMVVHGPARDVDTLRLGRFPLFSAGRHPRAPTRERAGAVALPVDIGGVAVNPGDLVIGDADGVVVVPRNAVAEVVEAAEAKARTEKTRLAEIAAGQLAPAWLEGSMHQAFSPRRRTAP